jgi:hypothetical protein
MARLTKVHCVRRVGKCVGGRVGKSQTYQPPSICLSMRFPVGNRAQIRIGLLSAEARDWCRSLCDRIGSGHKQS